MKHKILKFDPYLSAYREDFDLRMSRYQDALARLGDLQEFANGHQYFGFHKTESGWYYREWAPEADKLYLTGDFCNWDRYAYPLQKKENGVFELFLPGQDSLRDGAEVMCIVVNNGQELERIPLYANYVVQNPETGVWNARIYDAPPFAWTDAGFKPQKKLFIYECHIGMAQDKEGIGSYREFRENILPRNWRLSIE